MNIQPAIIWLILVHVFTEFKITQTIQCHVCSNRFSWDYCQPGVTIECPAYMDACAKVLTQGSVNPFEERSEFSQLYLRQCTRFEQCNNKNLPLCDGHSNCNIRCCQHDFCNDY